MCDVRANHRCTIKSPGSVVRDTASAGRAKRGRAPAFQIAEVEQVVMPTREQRNARRK
jgi:hypothetical protein